MGDTAKQEAICWPSVEKTAINDALLPISQWGNVSSRHCPDAFRLCGVLGTSNFGELTFDSLYCHTSNFRPQTAQAHPLFEQLIETAVFLSVNVNASLTMIGSGSPNGCTTLFSDRVMIWLDCTERPETLYRLKRIKRDNFFLGYVRYFCLISNKYTFQ